MTIEIKAKKIEFEAVKKLKPHKLNPNKHTATQIEQMVKCIDYQGFRVPLIVSNLSGCIVSGEGRWEMAKALKMDRLPVIYQDFENEAQEYAFMVSDNELGKQSKTDLSMVNEAMINFGPDFDLIHFGMLDFKLDLNEEPEEKIPGESKEKNKITFNFSAEQMDILREAMDKAKKNEDCTDEINKNKNANIMTAILKRYLYG